MSQLEKTIGTLVEDQMVSLLQMWGLNVEAIRCQGADLRVSHDVAVSYVEVKAVRSKVRDLSVWQTRDGMQSCNRLRDGKVIIRPESHEMLIQHQGCCYVFIVYELVTPDEAEPVILWKGIYWTPADHIHIKPDKRASISVSQLQQQFKSFHPRSFISWMKEG